MLMRPCIPLCFAQSSTVDAGLLIFSTTYTVFTVYLDKMHT
jgi:hypothetical protein